MPFAEGGPDSRRRRRTFLRLGRHDGVHRDGNEPLFVIEPTIYMKTLHGWERIPSDVTDFASIPFLATVLTGMDLKALGDHRP